MIDKDTLRKWRRERDAVMLKYDVAAFRRFYLRWRKLGVYEDPMPRDDRVIEIMMRKCVYHMRSATPTQRADAEQWLYAHGCSTDIG